MSMTQIYLQVRDKFWCAFELIFKSCTHLPDMCSDVPITSESRQLGVLADRTVSISSTLAHVIILTVSNRILLLTSNIYPPTSYSPKPLNLSSHQCILVRLFHLIQRDGDLLALAPQQQTRHSLRRVSIDAFVRRLGSGLAELLLKFRSIWGSN